MIVFASQMFTQSTVIAGKFGTTIAAVFTKLKIAVFVIKYTSKNHMTRITKLFISVVNEMLHLKELIFPNLYQKHFPDCYI